MTLPFDSTCMKNRFDYLVNVVARKSSRILNKKLQVLGISPRHFAVMGIIEGPNMSQSGITEKLQVNKNVMVALIDELEKKELCRRVQNPDNRREYHIQLTELGLKMREKADNIVQETQGEFLQPLSEKDKDRLCTLLERIAQEEQRCES